MRLKNRFHAGWSRFLSFASEIKIKMEKLCLGGKPPRAWQSAIPLPN
jgi:hypothetical protein